MAERNYIHYLVSVYVLNLFTLNVKILLNATRHQLKETCKNIKSISLILYLLLVFRKRLCVMTIGSSAAKLFLNELKEECYLYICLKQKLSWFFFFFFLWENILVAKFITFPNVLGTCLK